ncbi:hypothetical protein Tco_0205241 [Tanacetum coccineum]
MAGLVPSLWRFGTILLTALAFLLAAVWLSVIIVGPVSPNNLSKLKFSFNNLIPTSSEAFTASASVPAIYLQQFWNTMKYDEKTGVYRCQIDEQWFDLSADLLRKALAITPVIPAQPFELPPSVTTERLLAVTNPDTQFCKCCGESSLKLYSDNAELLCKFTQGIQTFFSHKASHKASLKDPKKKVTPLLIPYGRFSKVIIYYLASNNNIHRRPNSAVHHTGDDFILGNLKFVPKGKIVEVFGMAIPDPL